MGRQSKPGSMGRKKPGKTAWWLTLAPGRENTDHWQVAEAGRGGGGLLRARLWPVLFHGVPSLRTAATFGPGTYT